MSAPNLMDFMADMARVQVAAYRRASERERERAMAAEVMAKGAHIPRHWRIEHDDGDDGCMPSGWYLFGLDDNHAPIDWPINHEYGPYESIAAAEADRDALILAWSKV